LELYFVVVLIFLHKEVFADESGLV